MLVSDVLKAKARKVISIGPEATVKEALALFVKHNIGSLPVVEATGQLINEHLVKPVGIDALRALLSRATAPALGLA